MLSVLLGLKVLQVEPKVIPFQANIAKFQEKDLANPQKKGQILFIGSSSFTNWHDVNEHFPGKGIVNRAFGGSTLLDLIRHSDFLLKTYSPRQVVIYCGENDLADGKSSSQEVYERFVKFYGILRKELPKCPVAYVSMKPSWSRWHLRSKYIVANKWISDLTKTDKYFQFINVWDAMLDSNGRPMQDIFIKDELHMNSKGYQIWKPIIAPYLK